jgi:hypothetical protein
MGTRAGKSLYSPDAASIFGIKTIGVAKFQLHRHAPQAGKRKPSFLAAPYHNVFLPEEIPESACVTFRHRASIKADYLLTLPFRKSHQTILTNDTKTPQFLDFLRKIGGFKIIFSRKKPRRML